MNALLEHPKRHPITSQEFLRMDEAGVFGPDARLELIEGEIIEMAPIGTRHASVVAGLTELIVRMAADRGLVWVQSSLLLGDRSMPQPDLAVLVRRADRYFKSHPTASDVLLLVEVSDTTLAFDRDHKAPLYARRGVRELWIVDVDECVVHIHRDPGADGYGIRTIARIGEHARCASLPQIEIEVAELFSAE